MTPSEFFNRKRKIKFNSLRTRLESNVVRGGGSILSLNNGRDYNVPGRSANLMKSVNGTMHHEYSLNNNPTADKIFPSYLPTPYLNTIPTPTELSVTNFSKYENNLPEGVSI